MCLSRPVGLGILIFTCLIQGIVSYFTLTKQWLNCDMGAMGNFIPLSEFSFGLVNVGLAFSFLGFEKSAKVKLADVKKYAETFITEITDLVTYSNLVWYLVIFGTILSIAGLILSAAGFATRKQALYVGSSSILFISSILVFAGWAVYNYGVAPELEALHLADVIASVLHVGQMAGVTTALSPIKKSLLEYGTRCDDQETMIGSTMAIVQVLLIVIAAAVTLCVDANKDWDSGGGYTGYPSPYGQQYPQMRDPMMQMQQMSSGGYGKGDYGKGGYPRPSGGYPAPQGQYPGYKGGKGGPGFRDSRSMGPAPGPPMPQVPPPFSNA